MKKIYTTVLLLLFVVAGGNWAQAQSLTVNTFDEVVHSGANTIEQDFSFPTDVSPYSDIFMTVALTCPAGGCDPWDRFANIKVKHLGESYEIGRYITPYGNGNCSWTLDVSDYRNLLTGDVTLVSFIETWSNGWEVTVDFEFVPGTPQYEHIAVRNLWVDYQFTYGDTLFYSIDLDEVVLPIPSNSQKTMIRVVNTGHGQGNTQNAAEFLSRDHVVEVDGKC